MRNKFSVIGAQSPEEALQQMHLSPDVILLDLRFSDNDHDQTGMEMLQTLTKHFPEIPVIMATGFGDINIAVEAMRYGAADFIPKSDITISELITRLDKALENTRLKRRVEQLEKELKLVEPRQIIGVSPAIQHIKRIIEAAAKDSQITVLIRGETGTGKELVARAIHASGKRNSAPFISVLLNALPQTMLESELFGYEAGAFTDAKERRIGYLEKSRGGILFLDEIGEIEPSLQVKLLRFLEEKEFQRLGSTQNIKIDTQVITATNADLEERVKSGTFREDLYFRLKVHEINLSPLRSRSEDIPLLVSHFLEFFRQRGKRVSEISPEALQQLCNYWFPGNVRQLRNLIESALFNAEIYGHNLIEAADLPSEVTALNKNLPAVNESFDLNQVQIFEILARTELFFVQEALTKTQGRKNDACRLLGYHDRFVFARRIKRIFENFENLRNEFSTVYTKFRK